MTQASPKATPRREAFECPYDDRRDYPVSQIEPDRRAVLAAGAVERQINRLRRNGKLDARDMRIIAMRQESPMPSNCEVARRLHCTENAIRERRQKYLKIFKTACERFSSYYKETCGGIRLSRPTQKSKMALTVAQVDAAIAAVIAGGQSYTIDGTTFTRADLEALQKLRRDAIANARGKNMFQRVRFGTMR